MKKLLFIIAFAFTGQQAFSQIYIVATVSGVGVCSGNQIQLIKSDPFGNQTSVCINSTMAGTAIGELTQELNSVIDLGYKLIKITNPSNVSSSGNTGGGGLANGSYIANGTVWYFAIP